MSSEAGAGAGAGAGFRVTILHNGDFKTGGKALVIAPGTSLAELFDKAGKKLASGNEEQKFNRVFTNAGAEVTEVGEIFPNDTLFFSTGADFIFPDSVVVGSSSSSATVEKKHFIRNIAVSAAALAAYGYSHGADLLKARGPVCVGDALTALEERAVLHGKPLVTGALKYAEPAVEFIDSKLDVAAAKVVQKRDEFLNSDLAQQVNASITSNLASLKSNLANIQSSVVQPAETYFASAIDSFRALQASGGPVVLSDFIAVLRAKLGHLWSVSLEKPSAALFESLKKTFGHTAPASASSAGAAAGAGAGAGAAAGAGDAAVAAAAAANPDASASK